MQSSRDQDAGETMKTTRITSDRVADTYVAALLQEALMEVAMAFARANKTAALFTLASVERDLIARAEAFPAVMASPQEIGRAHV